MKRIFIIVTLILVVFLSGCEEEYDENVNVSFDTQGGTEIQDVVVDFGATIDEPIQPIKEGYTFRGWYSDSGYSDPFDFTTTLGGDITIYAAFEINQSSLKVDETTIKNNFVLEQFSLDDIGLIFVDSSGESMKLALDSSLISTDDYKKLQTLGEHSITVFYMNQSVEFTVNIVKFSNEIVWVTEHIIKNGETIYYLATNIQERSEKDNVIIKVSNLYDEYSLEGIRWSPLQETAVLIYDFDDELIAVYWIDGLNWVDDRGGVLLLFNNPIHFEPVKEIEYWYYRVVISNTREIVDSSLVID